MADLFEGLDLLGFNDLRDLKLYEDKAKQKKTERKNAEENPEIYLFMKSFECPVCDRTFEDRMVRKSKLKLVSSDADLRPYFDPVDPLIYDIIMCNHCGYAALGSYFNKITERMANEVKDKISPKFKPCTYPFVLTVDNAIERYKLALLNAVIKQAKSSEKAYICMKLAWLYRDKKDEKNEKLFLENACYGFVEAFSKEDMPMCGMDEYTVLFLISIFYKKIGQPKESMKWLGRIIISRSANDRVRQRAIDLKQQILQEAKNTGETNTTTR